MTKTKRAGATRTLAAIAVAGLIASAPSAAMTPGEALPFVDVVNVVQTLEVPAQTVQAPEIVENYRHVGQGEASYYGRELAGNRTASGERFNPQALTAAHRTLPLGSRIRVTNKANGKSVVVRVNDRGPFTGRRIIDVSLAAAQQIQMIRSGKAMVTLERLV